DAGADPAAVVPVRRAVPAVEPAPVAVDHGPAQPADVRRPPGPDGGVRATHPAAGRPGAAEPADHLVRLAGPDGAADPDRGRDRRGAAGGRRAPVPESRVTRRPPVVVAGLTGLVLL